MNEEIKKVEDYSNIPVSEKTIEGMSLNINDRAYLQRMFYLQDEVTQKYISDTYDTHAKLIIDTVKEMLDDRNKEIYCTMKDIKKSINLLRKETKLINTEMSNIKKTLSNHEKRIVTIEEMLNIINNES